eukprot:3750508-Prorocentrum_lima.AAC.1
MEFMLAKTREEVYTKQSEAKQSLHQTQALQQRLLAEATKQEREREDLKRAALQAMQDLTKQMGEKLAEERAVMQHQFHDLRIREQQAEAIVASESKRTTERLENQL